MGLITAFRNIFKIPELRARVLFTLAMLAVFRIGAHIPTPGIDGEALSKFLIEKGGAVMGFFDIFTGGALSKVTIFALGVMPYISASIIFQLLTVVIPALQKLAKEGEEGRKKITRYTRYATIVIAAIQGFGIAVGLETMGGGQFIQEPGWSFRLVTMITLTAGTAFLMWLGEQITERGIGNGISLIIFAGIVARLPNALFYTYNLVKTGELSIFFVISLVVVMVGVVAGIIYIERAQRRIPIQYAKRVIGRKMYGGYTSYLPLKINSAGVIPPIFASSVLMFPATIAGFIAVPWVQALAKQLAPGSFLHIIFYVGLIIFFTYFYTAVIYNPVEIAENLQKNGGYITGVRPGQKTAEYIYRVLSRLTFIGALYLSAVCILPEILISQFKVPFYFGGTSLLITVGVALDTVSQIETHMISRSYDGLFKKFRIKGRKD